MTLTIHNTELLVVRGSVIGQDVDAVVNAANTSMQGGGGIDGQVHKRAGSGLLDELRRVAPHGAKTAQVVVTGGHNLPHQFIFHVAGPRWRDGNHGEPDLLASCYRGCLEAADAKCVTSIGFCSISTGVYGYPIELAAPLAVKTVIGYLTEHSETTLSRVVFAMYGEDEFQHFEKALADAAGETK